MSIFISNLSHCSEVVAKIQSKYLEATFLFVSKYSPLLPLVFALHCTYLPEPTSSLWFTTQTHETYGGELDTKETTTFQLILTIYRTCLTDTHAVFNTLAYHEKFQTLLHLYGGGRYQRSHCSFVFY